MAKTRAGIVTAVILTTTTAAAGPVDHIKEFEACAAADSSARKACCEGTGGDYHPSEHCVWFHDPGAPSSGGPDDTKLQAPANVPLPDRAP